MAGYNQEISEGESRKASLRQKFQEFDKDGNGLISLEEVQHVLCGELGFTSVKAKSLVAQYDINNDGNLSYEEFIGFFGKVQKKKSLIDKAFHKFDAENKGYVSIEDAKRIFCDMNFTDEEVEALVKVHDANGDGKLQYVEFVKFWSY